MPTYNNYYAPFTFRFEESSLADLIRFIDYSAVAYFFGSTLYMNYV